MTPTPTANIGSYEDRLSGFRWSQAEAALGYEPGGRINIGCLCSDRICRLGKASKTALIWEGPGGAEKRYTFDDIRRASNTIAVLLQTLGVEREQRVCLLMDRIPELYISFLAVLKLGAVVQPLFSAFGEESLLVRLENARTTAVITQRKHAAKVRRIRERLASLRHVVIVDGDGDTASRDGETAFCLERARLVDEFAAAATVAESPSVLHYTSGTSGMPKGVRHVHYSIVSQYLTAQWVLDLRDDDMYWCTADPGWVTGTSYGIIGPWSMGVTQCVLDGGFTAEAWYRFIERRRISVWYSAPTAVRALMRAGEGVAKRHDLSSLRHLASVGEPLNAEAVLWSERVYGRPFHDTYWQTETGSIVISNYPGARIKPGSMGRPFPGVAAAVLDPKTFQPRAEPGQVGLIALRPDWPAALRGYWLNDDAFAKKLRNGWYLTGDRGRIDRDGYYWFVGRDDDVINTAGHLVSPFEVESALLEHPAVAESAVVSKPDEANMEVVKAFVSLKPGREGDAELKLDIMNFVRKRLSSMAMPQEIEFLAGLPKTRSGKIMRRMLRAREWGQPLGDVSTLDGD